MSEVGYGDVEGRPLYLEKMLAAGTQDWRLRPRWKKCFILVADNR